MKYLKFNFLFSTFGLFIFALLCFSSCAEDRSNAIMMDYPSIDVRLDPARAQELISKVSQEVSPSTPTGLKLKLWAMDSLLADPIAISVDRFGAVYYTQGNRLAGSEFDIRGHRNWMTESISFESVEDRRAFIRKTFADDSEEGKKFLKDFNQDSVLNWKDLTAQQEEVWRVSDEDNDGLADRAQLYIQDFHEEITDLANGVEVFDKDVYIAVGPDLWKTTDIDGDGIADQKESLAHGFAVHIGFGAHGMSGVTMGPDGRIWWGIGDIGANVVDRNGKRWKYPNQGVIARCEPDGSNFEIFSAGHRNTHEFVFDKYGNLISVDNDGDHPGERERLVHIINGSDSGWRINWQFGKYTDPNNNKYKVWMDEKLGVPHWEGQAAYILPPIQNYVNGPTGMVYNPGTALSEKYNDHFFIAEFRGNPANSPIHAFTLKPKGASFALDTTYEVVQGLLPTGLDFASDGSLFFADWITGWGSKDGGRIWNLDVPEGEKNQLLRKQTKEILESDFYSKDKKNLAQLLEHPDMRVRSRAQFALVKKGEAAYPELLEVAKKSKNQLGRIHALWGIGQFTRRKHTKTKDLIPFLNDQDPEIIAQAARMIGDVRFTGANDRLIELVNHSNARIRLNATEALGRIGTPEASDAIIKMIANNNDNDKWLRHAGGIALGRIGDTKKLESLTNNSSLAIRLAAVVALRRMSSETVALFLKDENELVVTEAARAINDDWSISKALPELAALLANDRFNSEPLMRRAINAALRVGETKQLDLLIQYAQKENISEELRAEAIAALSTWAKPSVLDRVDGRYRGEINRDLGAVQKRFAEQLPTFFKTKSEIVLIALSEAIARLELSSGAEYLQKLAQENSSEQVKAAALTAYLGIDLPNKKDLLATALKDKSTVVKSAAIAGLINAGIEETAAVDLFKTVLQNGSVSEIQASFAALANYSGTQAVQLLQTYFDKLRNNKLDPTVALDLVDAIELQGDAKLTSVLKGYEVERQRNDPLGLYRLALSGGVSEKGKNVYRYNPAGQCTRCHSIFEWGGDAGPNLAGVGERLSKVELLESLVDPSKVIATGYAMASIELKGEEFVAGTIISESNELITLRQGDQQIIEIKKSDIVDRTNSPSSMPGVKDKLTKKEIRDLVAYLSTLKSDDH